MANPVEGLKEKKKEFEKRMFRKISQPQQLQHADEETADNSRQPLQKLSKKQASSSARQGKPTTSGLSNQKKKFIIFLFTYLFFYHKIPNQLFQIHQTLHLMYIQWMKLIQKVNLYLALQAGLRYLQKQKELRKILVQKVHGKNPLNPQQSQSKKQIKYLFLLMKNVKSNLQFTFLKKP